MTVSTTDNTVSHNGDGASTAFAVPFAFFGQDELDVIERVVATGVETMKTLTTDYSVSGGNGSTGTVTAVTAPPTTVSWTIVRDTKLSQEINYTDNDPFPAETHEGALDRVTMIAQDAKANSDRSLRFPKTDASSISAEIPNSVSRASKFLAFDASGLPIASSGPTGDSSIPVSSFMETVLDDGDAASVRQTLGVEPGVDVEAFGAAEAAAAAVPPIGTVASYLGVAAPANWLLLNGETVGSAGSAANQKDAGYETLFKLLWNSMADTEAPVVGGRGASVDADWTANKAITLPDVRSRSVLGTGQGASLTDRVHGTKDGAETHQLTIGEMPSHDHGYGGGTAASGAGVTAGSGSALTTSSTGGDQAHNNMQPWLALTWMVKAK